MTNNYEEPYEPGVACIGIFWRVKQPSGSKLVSHVVSLEEADDYGDFLTHPSGHYEVWESWKREGVMGIRKMGLPTEIFSTEYEAHPRGRVVFNQTKNLFTIYADKRLQSRDVILEIAKMFGIEKRKYVIKSDSHYVETPSY